MRLPAADTPSWPDPDDHLVEPGTRYEVFEGERVYVSPARPGHGDTHNRLDMVIRHHVAPAYTASSDLLTRRSKDNDFATDTSIRRAGINPATGHRYLEEISFEIFFQESREYARRRARNMVRYGVRRMFGIFVKERWPGSDDAGVVDYTVAEWSADATASEATALCRARGRLHRGRVVCGARRLARAGAERRDRGSGAAPARPGRGARRCRRVRQRRGPRAARQEQSGAPGA